MNDSILNQLSAKGVSIPNPESVYIADDIDPERISGNSVVLYAGTKLIGSRTLIMDHSVIGYEGPVTLENTLVGPFTRLNGGYYSGAVFMGQNEFGSCAHVRPGTILEEEACAAHTVGLKQTILFPFVTLGSLINFCDCLMAGGTSRKNHSEVGSSFIHFNYTPNQDKATPSMFGNVSQGVMLNQSPVFLGGQGGVVGPVHLAFGNVTAAGSIIRKSCNTPDQLIMGGALKNMSFPLKPGVYTQVTSIFNHNISYIAALFALKSWYRHVRPLFATDTLSGHLILGLRETLDLCIEERIKRLLSLKEKFLRSKQIISQKAKGQSGEAVNAHDVVLERLSLAESLFRGAVHECAPATDDMDICIRQMSDGIKKIGPRYVPVIQNLSPEGVRAGVSWLCEIERHIVEPLEIRRDKTR